MEPWRILGISVAYSSWNAPGDLPARISLQKKIAGTVPGNTWGQRLSGKLLGEYLNRQLPEVLPLQQSHERFWGILQSVHDVFAIFDLPRLEPFRHLLPELAKVRSVILK